MMSEILDVDIVNNLRAMAEGIENKTLGIISCKQSLESTFDDDKFYINISVRIISNQPIEKMGN